MLMYVFHIIVSFRLYCSSCIVILIYSGAVNSCSSSSKADNKQVYCQEKRFASPDACPLAEKILQTDCKLEDINRNEDVNNRMTSLAVIPYDESSLPLHTKAVRHFVIAGHKFTIHQDYFRRGVSAFVWDSAVVLAKYLEKHQDLVQDKRVLELGAGTGLTGLVAAALGADVTVTERAEVITHLTSSISLNTQDKPWKISAQALDWTEKLDVQNLSEFDVILGSDIIYVEDTFHDLLRTIKTLAPSSKVHILLSCRIRYDRDLKFLDMLRADFDVDEIFVDTEKKIQVFSVRRRS